MLPQILAFEGFADRIGMARLVFDLLDFCQIEKPKPPKQTGEFEVRFRVIGVDLQNALITRQCLPIPSLQKIQCRQLRLYLPVSRKLKAEFFERGEGLGVAKLLDIKKGFVKMNASFIRCDFFCPATVRAR